MDAFAIDHHFTAGPWSYQEGEVLSRDDLEARDLTGDALAKRIQRGGIRQITSVADLDPSDSERRGTFGDEARARAAALLAVPGEPDPEPEPE
jgi:hypothetical protein